MRSRFAPFLIGSLFLHIGLIAFFQAHKKGAPPPPIVAKKALVHTVYLKPEAPKKIASQKPTPPKKIAAQKPDPPKKIAASAPAKKASASVAKPKQKVDTPKPTPPPTISGDYAQEIAMQLKLLLSLPEYGEVKVGLRLSAKGEIANVEILESQSTANEKYLLEMLPKLTLPPPPQGDLPLKLTLSNA